MIDYRQRAMKLRNPELSSRDLLGNAAMGLSGEAGEVTDLVKKVLYQNHVMDRDKMIKELGDVRWYMELFCELLDVSMDEIEYKNIEKLEKRYPNGFSVQASVNREVNDPTR